MEQVIQVTVIMVVKADQTHQTQVAVAAVALVQSDKTTKVLKVVTAESEDKVLSQVQLLTTQVVAEVETFIAHLVQPEVPAVAVEVTKVVKQISHPILQV